MNGAYTASHGGGVCPSWRQSPLGTPGNRSRRPARFPLQPPGASLRDSILLITILVAFLEATAQQSHTW
jgi:hypothetical protein